MPDSSTTAHLSPLKGERRIVYVANASVGKRKQLQRSDESVGCCVERE